MMIAPALPMLAADDMVLNNAAMPAAPAVTAGMPMGAATAAAPAVVAAVWKKLLTAPPKSWPPASSPATRTFWMTSGAAMVLNTIQKATTTTPTVDCSE